MRNKKFKNVHQIADLKLVEEFNPHSDKVDNLILGQLKNRSPNSYENNPSPKMSNTMP